MTITSAEERVNRLEARVADLCGLLNAASAALVDTIAEVIATESWEGGYRSPEHWVAVHCAVGLGHARRLCDTARRIDELPLNAALFRQGQLSADQAAVVFRGTTADRDADIAGVAPYATVTQLRRIVSSLPPPPPPRRESDPEPHPEPQPQSADAEREVRFGAGDGTWDLRAVLPADEGALVQKALEAARTDIFGERVPGVTWADALVRLAHVALDTLDPGVATTGRPSQRYQVILHVHGETGAARTHLGQWLEPGIAELLLCDTTYRVAVHKACADAVDRLVGISPSAETVDPKLRAVIEHRDGGCRVPGCEQTRWLHIHHIGHREHGGLTIPSNLAALCPPHHRQHHQGRLGIQGDPDKPNGLRFTDRWGKPIGPAPPNPPPNLPLATAATQLGINNGRAWQHPTGEPLQAGAIVWQTDCRLVCAVRMRRFKNGSTTPDAPGAPPNAQGARRRRHGVATAGLNRLGRIGATMGRAATDRG